MEAFESFVAVALEYEHFVVCGPVKFPVALTIHKPTHIEVQTHGFEVDLVAARADQLVLATVKSFFGSQGVKSDHVTGTTTDIRARKLYRLLNDVTVRNAVVEGAAARYGYTIDQIRLRFYVGRFAAPMKGSHETKIRDWCATQHVGGGPIDVRGVADVITAVKNAAASKQYKDNPILVTMKVLEAGGLLNLKLPDDIGTSPTALELDES